jgi:hypothetical protein
MPVTKANVSPLENMHEINSFDTIDRPLPARSETDDREARERITLLFGHLRVAYLDFKVRPGTRKQTWVRTDNPTSLKVSTDLGCCTVFIQLYTVLVTCPRTQGYGKNNFFRTNHRSVRARARFD